MANVYTESPSKRCSNQTEGEDEETHRLSDDHSKDTVKNWSSPTLNPFAQKPALKADIVTSHHSAHSVILAPSKFSSSQGTPDEKKEEQKEAESSSIRSSILLPSRLGMLNKVDPDLSPSKCLLRPSALTAQVQNLKQKDPHQKEKENLEKQSENNGQESSSPEKKDVESIDKSGANCNPTTEDYFAAALKGKEGQIKLESSTDHGGGSEFIFGQNLNERVTGVAPTSNCSGFVFGQNLADRVVQSESSDKKEREEDSTGESEISKSSNSGEQKNAHLNFTLTRWASTLSRHKARTLEESARDFQAKHERKTEFKEIEIKTGEENESNVLQSSAKLFVFDAKNQSWNERGRGLLRLNDSGSACFKTTEFQSRLVMRTHGSLKVILNTKIWSGMTVERASPKSIRITATDGEDGIKVFLIMTSPKDCENILRAVDWRIQKLRVMEESAEESKSGEKRKADTDDNYSDENTCSNKKVRGSDEAQNVKREESDSSVVDPETDVSSESYTSSSLAVRSDTE